jgi:hypothetical protein
MRSSLQQTTEEAIMEPRPKSEESPKLDVTVRPLQESDLPTADRLMRLAFGTFIGLPEPTAFLGDATFVRTRWFADPNSAFAAEVGCEFVGDDQARERVEVLHPVIKRISNRGRSCR